MPQIYKIMMTDPKIFNNQNDMVDNIVKYVDTFIDLNENKQHKQHNKSKNGAFPGEASGQNNIETKNESWSRQNEQIKLPSTSLFNK